MQDGKNLIQKVAGQLSEQAQQAYSQSQQQSRAAPPSSDHIDAINQVFTLFRVNYHNQYYKAFGSDELLVSAKKLWLESLQKFSPETILRGAKRAIETCDFLPTLKKMIDCCQGDRASHGLPEAHDAYIEACNAPSPKTAYQWSHPAVYHAGKMSDWHFLGTSAERIAFPVFQKNYQQLCERVISGEQLPAPTPPALPDHSEEPLSKAENHKRMLELMKALED